MAEGSPEQMLVLQRGSEIFSARQREITDPRQSRPLPAGQGRDGAAGRGAVLGKGCCRPWLPAGRRRSLASRAGQLVPERRSN